MVRKRRKSNKENKTGLKAIADVTEELFSSFTRTAAGKRFSVFRKVEQTWLQIAGPVMSLKVKPSALQKNGKLVLVATSSAWKNEAQCLKRQLLKKIALFVGNNAIKDISIKTEKIPDNSKCSNKSSGKRSLRLLFPDEEKRINKTVSSISDNELQQVLTRIFANSMRVRTDESDK